MKLKLNNVRLAFPNLFEAKAVNDGAEKFSASFIFPRDHDAVKPISAAMVEVAKQKWGERAGAIFKGIKAQDRLCLHDGATKAEYAGYDGNLYLNASNSLRPTVVDRNRTPLTMAEGKLYSGCFVNAVVEVWAQDNKHGKRINASLLGVQFNADGERLAGGSVASEDDFDEIPMDGDVTGEFGEGPASDGFGDDIAF